MKRIAYTSLPRADSSKVSFAPDHLQTEEAIKATGLLYLLFRNCWYQENLFMSLPTALASGQWYTSAGDGKTSFVARDDIAAAIAAALANPPAASKTYTMTGTEALDHKAVAELVASVTGKPLEVVNLTDLTATLLDIAGAPPLPNADGRSFVARLADAHAPWFDRTYSEYVNDGVPPWAGGREVIQRMIREGRYKYIYHHGHPGQLFDLEADPDETRDLADDPAYAAIAAQLRARVLEGWSPEAISDILASRRDELALLEAWGRATKPDDLIRWKMKPTDSWLARNADEG